MDKYNSFYDLDFKSFDEIMQEILGIVDLNDIDSLKNNLKETLIEVDDVLTRKKRELLSKRKEKLSELSKNVLEINSKIEKGSLPKEELEYLKNKRVSMLKDIENLQSEISKLKSTLLMYKNRLSSQLDVIDSEEDIDNILKLYIGIRCLSIQRLEDKILLDDSEEVKNEKKQTIRNANLILDISRSASSFSDLIVQRNELLEHIDTENRIIQFDTQEPAISDNDSFLFDKLDIIFRLNPEDFPDEYGKMLKDAGIYAYRFGMVKYSNMPTQNGQYVQQCSPKELVGVIKKDEVGQIKRYVVLMEQFSRIVPPEFYRDVLFSDMALRNAENNFGYLGEAEVDHSDEKYGYRLGFKGFLIKDLLRAIYFEGPYNFVEVNCNNPLISGVKDARILVDKKMDQMLDKLFSIQDDELIGEK